MNKLFNELKKFSNKIIAKEIRQIKVTLIMQDNSQLVWTQVALLVFILEPQITVALTGHEKKILSVAITILKKATSVQNTDN